MNKKILIASIFATLMLLVPMTSVVGVISKNATMDNQPPNPPRIDGQTRGKVGVAYEFTFVTTDPDGDNVSYYVDWDDGNITNWTAFQSSGYPGYSESHTWTQKGIYFVRCKANDTHGAESDWGIHYGIIVGTKKVTHVTVDNQPPDKPKVTGPYFPKAGIPYKCAIRAIDPDGDNASYQIDWDDGEISEWTDWYPSGEKITQSHTYSSVGDFGIRARAKDTHGAIGDWGYITFGISKSKQIINLIFFQFIEQFPILQKILLLQR